VEAGTLFWILAAGLATGIGGLALLALPRPSDRLLDGLLGFTAGVMLAATAFSLLVPALDLGTVAEVLLSFSLGSAALCTLGSELGVPIALAIAIQNIPEGFAASAPLARGNRRVAALVAALTGIVEPPAALVALAAFSLASTLLPVGLGFAAGAMLYVVADELIPESHSRGNERIASVALLGGFALMMTLDNAFG
jgi:zinc transporter, ZIP family